MSNIFHAILVIERDKLN
uniref:Uncharacterized protein n=1 Tax=Rhizophora mucronata TaxID=61149 RepID=A0A2P2P1E4_RHIMU